MQFNEEVKRFLVGKEDRNTAAEVRRDAARKMLGMTSGQRKENKLTDDGIKKHKKVFNKNGWQKDSKQSEEQKQRNFKLASKAKRIKAVAVTKETAYQNLFSKLD